MTKEGANIRLGRTQGSLAIIDKSRRPGTAAATAPPSRTLGARLRAERHRLFVGRDDDLALFRRLLGQRERSLLFLSGPVGVGKGSLLGEYERLCHEGGNRVAAVDGGTLGAAALDSRCQMHQRILVDLSAIGPTPAARPVLLLDEYEKLGAAEPWLLTDLIAGLPKEILLVFASRRPPPLGLSLDRGWARLMEAHELQPLGDAEAHALLDRLGVPRAAQAGVVETAAGYPLALTLAAQVLRRSSLETFTLGSLREWQRLLALALFPEPVSRVQSLVLDVCSLARTTTPELVEHVLGGHQEKLGGQAQELFDWLAHQSFIERTSGGLRPHLLARLALFSRARHERPRGHQLTYRAVREFVVDQVASGLNAELGMTDLFFLDREIPVVRQLGGLEGEGDSAESTLEVARATDHAAIVELVAALEGRRSSEIAAARLRTEPHGFEIVRTDLVDAVLHVTHLTGGAEPGNRLPPEDPVTAIVTRFMTEHPLECDEEATLFRWFIDRRHYQTPHKRVLVLAARQAQIVMSAKRLAYSLCVYRNPKEWAPFFQGSCVPWQIVGRFALDGHDYAVVAFVFGKRPLRDLLINAWHIPSGDDVAAPSASAEGETRLKVRQRVADLGRKIQLTPREHQILELFSLGSSASEIATRLQIRPRTVKFHCENLLRKTGASSRSDLFRLLL